MCDSGRRTSPNEARNLSCYDYATRHSSFGLDRTDGDASGVVVEASCIKQEARSRERDR